MKVTVIATGFKLQDGEFSSPAPFPVKEGVEERPPTEPAEPIRDEPRDIPFYRKVVAQARDDDPNGFGPNWSNVDDFDIPTVLRKQMD
jgi:hypothetical protein